MTRSSLFFIWFVLAAFFTTSLFASNGTQIGTVGARTTAMGSATRGLADDWSAFFFNPAGLTRLSGTTFGVSYGLISPAGSYQPAPYPNYHFSGMQTTKRNLKEQTFQVPAVGFFFQPRDRITLGIGLMAPFGLGARFDLLRLPSGYGNSAAGLSDEHETYSDHEVAFFQPTFAYELTDRISFGFGVGYTERGSLEINQFGLPLLSAMDPRISPLLSVFQGAGVLNPDHRRLVAETNLEGKGHAWTFSAGALFRVSDALQIGVSGRFYTPLKLEGIMETTAYLPGLTTETESAYQAALRAFIAASDPSLPPEQIDAMTAQNMGALTQAMSGGVSGSRYYAEADLPLPATIGAGIAFKPFPRLTLTADVSWTNWAAWDTIEVDLQYQETKSKGEMVQDWENTIEIALGAEYRAVDAGKFKLDLRAGGYRVPSPAPVSTINPTILDPNTRIAITGGLGLTYGRVMLSVAYERVTFGEKSIGAGEYVFDASGVNQNWPGVYDMSASVITVGLSVSR
ncbi:MAG TPA: hypothetical protein ENN17_10100 [bacterium]|nr:hypothetical protein [bacterium]